MSLSLSHITERPFAEDLEEVEMGRPDANLQELIIQNRAGLRRYVGTNDSHHTNPFSSHEARNSVEQLNLRLARLRNGEFDS